MRIYDISLTITPDMPTWPGDPGIVIERAEKIEEGAQSNTTRLEMSAHTGTHVDAPYHFVAEGKTVETLDLRVLTGRAYVLHLPEVETITAEIMDGAGIPPRTRRILFRTRNSDYWTKGEKAFQRDFAAISADGAEYLVDRGVKLVGVDYLSIAPFTEPVDTHKTLLKAGVVIVEGLDLSEVSQGRYAFYCLPLKILGSDGSPARAILVGV